MGRGIGKVAFPAAVVMIVVMMVIPLPDLVIDLLVSCKHSYSHTCALDEHQRL